jgi:hypothetical protein
VLQQPFNWLLRQRLHRLNAATTNPIAAQNTLLMQLLAKGAATVYGKRFSFGQIKIPQAFQEQVPLCTYESLYPYIEKTLKGQQGVLWPTPIQWFAKSSGTTNDRSKFIPVSSEALQEGHFKAGKDMLALYIAHYPHSNRLWKGKTLTMGGSLHNNHFCKQCTTMYGDISAVIMQNLPHWARWFSAPPIKIALLANLEEKVTKLVQTTCQQNITALAGVPTWILLVLHTVLAHQKVEHIRDIWPQLGLFIHGGISFEPYKEVFATLLGPSVHYMEVYNASEGFFAIQDRWKEKDMLLLTDHGVYYEFIPLEEADKPQPTVLTLSQVEKDKVYAMVITTNAGLWRYQIGDTVQFTLLAPYRIKVVGRTKHFINAFGEELLIHNAEAAMAHACKVTGALLREYTAGPAYTQQGGHHEWMIEFIHPPHDIARFAAALDKQLKVLNSDYEAKRYEDLVLGPPKVKVVPPGTFYAWLKKQDKVGEQQKVPRLFNNRKYLDNMHLFLEALPTAGT